MSNQNYTWTANVVGGDGIYEFQWRSSEFGPHPVNIPGETSSTITTKIPDGYFQWNLSVDVTDDGDHSYGTKVIYLDMYDPLAFTSLANSQIVKNGNKTSDPFSVLDKAPQEIDPDFDIYPNPLSQNSVMLLSLPEDTFVSVNVYDLSGKSLKLINSIYMYKGLNTVPLSSLLSL